MSADNWAVCPRCLYRAEAVRTRLIEKAQKDVEEAYGKASISRFDELRAVLAKESEEVDREQVTTLREDWEIGIWDGEFEVIYSAQCGKCQLAHNFRIKEPVRGIEA